MKDLGWMVVDINDVPPKEKSFQKGWKSIRWHMGIRSFGVNAATSDEGEWLTDDHDHADENQDELYYVVEGKVLFCMDGKSLIGLPGCLLSVKPHVKRSAKSLETPTF